MSKRMLMVGVILCLAVAWCMNAYADAAAASEGVTAWHGFWNSVGGLLHNALPWNWGNWMGK